MNNILWYNIGSVNLARRRTPTTVGGFFFYGQTGELFSCDCGQHQAHPPNTVNKKPPAQMGWPRLLVVIIA